MRDYGKVSTAIHTNPKSAAWSDNAFRIAIYLLAGPHTNMIGCFRLPVGYVAEDLRKDYETVREALDELADSGFLAYDEEAKWVWIKGFLEHNPFENANVAKSARKLAFQVPAECQFYAEFCRTISALGKWRWEKAGDLSEGLPNPSETLREQTATPEPEPEPESSSNDDVASASRSSDETDVPDEQTQCYRAARQICGREPDPGALVSNLLRVMKPPDTLAAIHQAHHKRKPQEYLWGVYRRHAGKQQQRQGKQSAADAAWEAIGQ